MIHGANVDSSDFCASLVGARQVVVASLLSPQEQSVHAVHELHWLSASMLVSKVVGETESAAAHEAQHSPANPKAAKVIRTSPTAPIEMGVQFPCLRMPGMKATIAIKKQTKAIHL